MTLTCSATGDTPLVYQWTMQDSDIILNSDNTTGILMLTSITEAEFGTYVCTVSNALGMATSDIALEQGGIYNYISISNSYVTYLSVSQWLQLLGMVVVLESVLELI